jgi:hypothetical protein
MITAHVAAEYDDLAHVQRCARCGRLLKENDVDLRTEPYIIDMRQFPNGTYPTGARIERAADWQAIVFSTSLAPLCNPLVLEVV